MIFTERERNLADAVLAYVKALSTVNILHNVECTVDPYINGREYGYVLRLFQVGNDYVFSNNALWIAFSENRNSDDIVVYTDQDVWTGEITEKSYNERAFFSFNKPIEAAEYIISLLTNKVKDIKD